MDSWPAETLDTLSPPEKTALALLRIIGRRFMSEDTDGEVGNILVVHTPKPVAKDARLMEAN
jgi:hypothetical protein